MKTEKALKIGSVVFYVAGAVLTPPGLLFHPGLLLGFGLLGVGKACNYAANSLSVAATIVENREDIRDNIHDAAETVSEGVDKVLSSANKNLHDAGETIHSLLNHSLEENVEDEDEDVASSGEVTDDVAEDFA